MRAVTCSVGAVVALGVASIAAACFGDPDEPIATARFVAAPAAPNLREVAEAAPPVPPEEPVQTPSAPRYTVAVVDSHSEADTGAARIAGLTAYVPARRGAAVALAAPTGPPSRFIMDRNLLRGFGEMQALGEKARLFLFAGDRNNVWTYNFTHDQSGFKAAGWTNERADGIGERRMGQAWQGGRTRVALTAMERKFSAFGAEMKDRVLAMTISFSPGWSSKRDHEHS